MKLNNHFVTKKRYYKQAMSKMEELFYLGAAREGLPERIVKPIFQNLIFFEFDYILTPYFWSILQQFSNISGDTAIYLVSLDPDADSYFYTNFQRFGMIKLSPDESDEDYYNALIDEPIDSPADSLQMNTNIISLFGSSGHWAIWGEREFGLGIATIKPPLFEWPSVKEFQWISDSSTVIDILASNFKNNKIPDDFLLRFKSNYL